MNENTFSDVKYVTRAYEVHVFCGGGVFGLFAFLAFFGLFVGRADARICFPKHEGKGKITS